MGASPILFCNSSRSSYTIESSTYNKYRTISGRLRKKIPRIWNFSKEQTSRWPLRLLCPLDPTRQCCPPKRRMKSDTGIIDAAPFRHSIVGWTPTISFNSNSQWSERWILEGSIRPDTTSSSLEDHRNRSHRRRIGKPSPETSSAVSSESIVLLSKSIVDRFIFFASSTLQRSLKLFLSSLSRKFVYSSREKYLLDVHSFIGGKFFRKRREEEIKIYVYININRIEINLRDSRYYWAILK